MSCLRKFIWIADFYRDLGVCMPPLLYMCVSVISAYARGVGAHIDIDIDIPVCVYGGGGGRRDPCACPCRGPRLISGVFF